MNISLGSIVLLIAGFLLLRFASTILIKILGFLFCLVAAVGMMYYFSWGPFKEYELSVEQLELRYCVTLSDSDLCECVVQPLKRDMEQRFTFEELEKIKNNKAENAYVFKKSLASTKEEAIACLKLKGQEAKYQTFIHDLIPVNNQNLEWLTEKTKSMSRKLEGAIDSFNFKKDWIDNKY